MESRPATAATSSGSGIDISSGWSGWLGHGCPVSRRAFDEEDVAISAFQSFCDRAGQGQFPQLSGRDDLWRLLATLTVRKAVMMVRQQTRQKRGGRVLGASVFGAIDRDGAGDGGLAEILGGEPTPDDAVRLADAFDHLINKLPDEALKTIALSKLEGHTCEAIGAKLHIDENHRSQAAADPRHLERGRSMIAGSTLDATLAAADVRRIDAIRDRFEADWRAGRQPDLTSYLAEAPPGARTTPFRDLLNVELEYRHKNNVCPDVRPYHERFLDLAHLIDATIAAWNDRVIAARRDKAAEGTGGSMPTSPGSSPLGSQSSSWAEFPLGESCESGVTGYEILGELGRGGMGVVFKAHQVALRRLVALEMIKSGRSDTEAELVRFQNEAEAVAQLDHPHIILCRFTSSVDTIGGITSA